MGSRYGERPSRAAKRGLCPAFNRRWESSGERSIAPMNAQRQNLALSALAAISRDGCRALLLVSERSPFPCNPPPLACLLRGCARRCSPSSSAQAMTAVCVAATRQGPPGCVASDVRRHHKRSPAVQRHRQPAARPPPCRRRSAPVPRALPADEDAATQHVVLPESEGTTAAAAGSLIAEELEEAAADAAAAAVAAEAAGGHGAGAEAEAAAEGGLLASKEVREMLAFAIPALGMVLAGGECAWVRDACSHAAKQAPCSDTGPCPSARRSADEPD